MKFANEDIRIEPGHVTRTWQSCNYFVGDTYLFHERDYCRTAPAGYNYHSIPGVLMWLSRGDALGDNVHQWFDYHDTQCAVEAVAKKHGGKALEEFYSEEGRPPRHFLAFASTEKALAFCRSEDFDKLCLTHAKN